MILEVELREGLVSLLEIKCEKKVVLEDILIFGMCVSGA